MLNTIKLYKFVWSNWRDFYIFSTKTTVAIGITYCIIFLVPVSFLLVRKNNLIAVLLNFLGYWEFSVTGNFDKNK